jgi:DNA-3-methyladenine glycosylase II
MGRPDARVADRAVRRLARLEPRFAAIVARHGPPPDLAREPGYATLVLNILEQQVSLASAHAAYRRLEQRVGKVTPKRLLALSDDSLRAVGFSRQKAAYARGVAQACLAGFDFDAVCAMDDAAAERVLTALPGVGPWTAHVYLMMALGRPDVFPARDLALQIAVQETWRLRARPGVDEMLRRAEAWRPERSSAARLLWHGYLARRGRALP